MNISYGYLMCHPILWYFVDIEKNTLKMQMQNYIHFGIHRYKFATKRKYRSDNFFKCLQYSEL
jgi:hypothetical protein